MSDQLCNPYAKQLQLQDDNLEYWLEFCDNYTIFSETLVIDENSSNCPVTMFNAENYSFQSVTIVFGDIHYLLVR